MCVCVCACMHACMCVSLLVSLVLPCAPCLRWSCADAGRESSSSATRNRARLLVRKHYCCHSCTTTGSLVGTILPHLPLSLQLHSVCQPPTWVPRGGHASDPRLCGAHAVQQPDLPRGRHCLGQEPAEHLCGLQWSASAVLGLLQVRGSTGERER